ncbi:MAG: response regulator [Lachnospiraceae bacterium]|nr:response regulator [Lachnospiraceae bacterium]
MKPKIKLIRQFGYLISAFIIVSLLVSVLVTYFSQTRMYRSLCKDRIISVGDYLAELILEDPDDFLHYKKYYMDHYGELRIPCDFSDYTTARDEFYHAFEEAYPGLSFKNDIKPQDLSDDLQLLYYTYRHEYWLLTFEQARKSFELPYTYFLVPDDETLYTMYMIDGERTEDKDHPGFLYMGDSYYEEPADHQLMWNTWHNAKRYDEVFEWNNEWGNTYSYYTPLVINNECVGLIVTEVDVKNVNSMITKSTFYLILQLGLILIFMTALLLFFINRNHIRRINHLSEQINEFSTSRAYDTVDAIREYPYGRDEIRDLANNTADMIKELQLHEEKIAQAAQFKSDFLANMSHEIRTPMNAVVGLSELLTKQELDEKSREYAENIYTSANTMLVIINDILDFTRIESGTMLINPMDYDVKKMVRDIVDITSIGLNDKPVEMKLNIAPDIPQYLHGDSARIRQIVMNILSNAVKFTAKGSIRINVDSSPIDEEHIGLKIRVADTGIGIMKKDYEKIFDSFSQVDSKRNRKAEGTGLGLTISQRLARLMGGDIKVESEYGVGSVFTITIPQEISGKNNADDGYVSSVPDKDRFSAPDAKILVVDDNSVNLYIAKSLMEQFDIHPTCVLSGAAALNSVKDEKFDLILMDHMMPGMDGIETMKKIRSEHPEYKDVPIIAFTANAVSEARDVLLESGMNDFISKPVKSEILEAMLKKWLTDKPADK